MNKLGDTPNKLGGYFVCVYDGKTSIAYYDKKYQRYIVYALMPNTALFGVFVDAIEEPPSEQRKITNTP